MSWNLAMRHREKLAIISLVLSAAALAMGGCSPTAKLDSATPSTAGNSGIQAPIVIEASDAGNQPHANDVRWERITLDKTFRSEGAAAFDVNHDGKVDVVAGEVWYEAPNWKMHEIRTPGKYNPKTGYSKSFLNFGYDVNGDGWVDLICIGFPGTEVHWYENPKNAPGHWKEHLVWHSACNETPNFLDLTGDGKPQLILGSQPEDQMGYLPIPPAGEAYSKWTFYPISLPGGPNLQGMDNGTYRYYHGLGVGDFNQDGRNDVITRHGWWEAPKDRSNVPWAFHPFKNERIDNLTPTDCANMFVEDLDLDGDMDLITSSAHAYGIWWWENIDGERLRQHVIDKSFSQSHAMQYVDINGDGQRDIVTGKRYFAHNGNDPGDYDPVVMVWYEVKRAKGSPPRFIRHEIVEGRDTGIGTQFEVTDVNGDGLPDIVLSNKKGVNILMQRRR
jgi:VCBS repeat protein